MTRRYMIIALLLAVLGTVSVIAQSRGGEHRLGGAVGIPNGVLLYRPSPFEVKAGYDFTEGKQFVFLAGDIRLIDNRPIVGVLHGSFGFGAFGKLFPEGRDGDGDVQLDAGARIPLALSVLLLDDFLEFFVEVSPGIDMYPKPRLSSQPVQLFAGFTVQLD